MECKGHNALNVEALLQFTIDALITTNFIVLNVAQPQQRNAIMDSEQYTALSVQDVNMEKERIIVWNAQDAHMANENIRASHVKATEFVSIRLFDNIALTAKVGVFVSIKNYEFIVVIVVVQCYARRVTWQL